MALKQPQSIDKLSTITSDVLEDTDFFVVETANGTRKIDYENMKSALGGGSSGLALSDVSGANISTSGRSIYLRWTDPNDIVLDGFTFAEWEGTKIVRKEGVAPANRSDGTVVLDSKVRNQYSSTSFVDENLEYGTLYYYKFFPYTTDKKYTSGTTLSESPKRVTLTAVPSQLGYLNYDGTQKTAVFNNYNSSQLTVTGNKGTNAGSYTAVFTPKEGYSWSDGSTDSKTVVWTIQKRTIHIPTVSGNFTYDGYGHFPAISHTVTYDFNEDNAINTSGSTFGSDAGTYTITFSLKDTENYQWEDGTINDKNRTWTIKKADGSFTLSKTSVTLNKSTPSDTVSITVVGDGTISISNSNGSIVTSTLSADERTISLQCSTEENGEAEITVSLSATNNYTAPGVQKIYVTNTYVRISSWTNATDAEIVAMVESAKRGEIDLSDYWAVGDERVVHLSAMPATYVGETHAEQDITLVLIHEGEYDLATPTSSGRNKCSFVVAMKKTFYYVDDDGIGHLEPGYMNPTATNIGSWKACARRKWCNEVFYNAIPSTLRPIFAKFKCYTGSSSDYNSELEMSEDYFALFSGAEVFGDRVNSFCSKNEKNNLIEFDYKVGSFACYLRSPCCIVEDAWYNDDTGDIVRTYSTESFCVSDTNDVHGSTANTNNDIIVFGCIN